MKVLLVSIVVGLFALAFVGALVFWARWSRGRDVNAVQLVAKNSGFLLLSQFTNKGLDFLFALYMLRALGPTGSGQYQYAILVWLYLKTVTDFGMGTLATQRIAQEPGRAGRLLGETTLLRLALLALSLPPLALFLGANVAWGGIGVVQVGAVALLALSVMPTAYTDAATSVFNGRERFEIPAAVTILGSIAGLLLRTGTLLAGWGPVGLALAAVVANLLTLGPILLLIRRLGVRVEWSLPWGAARRLLRDGGPLLVNGLLQSLFFTLDVFILQPLKGDAAVGLYGVSVKLINTFLIISSTFTLVLFPQLARQAARDRAMLARMYHLAVRLLLVIALPLSVGATVLAPELVRIIGGKAYLPGAATALRLIIWLLPFSFVNGVTQYVLIALGQQRRMTWAFAVTVVFNIVANLLFIPAFSYSAAAVISVLSEIILLVPFVFWVGRSLGPLPAMRLGWQPVVAASLFAFIAWVAGWRLGWGPWVGAILGGAGYCVALLALGTFGVEERALVRRLAGRVDPNSPPAQEAPAFLTGEGGGKTG